MSKIKKIISIFLLILMTLLFPARSHAWDAIPAEIMGHAMDEVTKHIDGIQLSMLQQQAMKMLNGQLEKMVGGGSGGDAKFITDWRKVLETDPQKITKTFINSGIDSSLNGKGSLSQYIPTSNSGSKTGTGSTGNTPKSEGFGSLMNLASGGGGTGGYASQLATLAKQSSSEYKPPVFDFQGSPSQVTSEGTWKKLGNLLDEKKINYPTNFVDYWRNEYDQKLVSEKKIAETKAVAYQGFIGTGDKNGQGMITNPGILIKEAIANTQDIGNKIIAGATHPEQIISAVVSQMITQAIEKGIGEVSKMVDKQMGQMTQKAQGELNNAIKTSGPGAAFNNPLTGARSTNNSANSTK